MSTVVLALVTDVAVGVRVAKGHEGLALSHGLQQLPVRGVAVVPKCPDHGLISYRKAEPVQGPSAAFGGVRREQK